jgi:hypothetical protein
MSDATRLRVQAERCFRLARGSVSTRLADELEALGRAFEREARKVEACLLHRSVQWRGAGATRSTVPLRPDFRQRSPRSVKHEKLVAARCADHERPGNQAAWEFEGEGIGALASNTAETNLRLTDRPSGFT